MKTLKTILLLLIIMSVKMSDAQMKMTRQENKEFYDTGELKKLVFTKIKKQAKIDLYNNYIRTVIIVTEFYPEGTIKSRDKIVDKIGEAGGPCYHILTSRKEYDEEGNICYYYKSRCDKRKLFYKVYNDGRLLNTTVTKRQRWE